MKKFFLVVSCMLFSFLVNAQSPEVEVSKKITQKMKDTLTLSPNQTDSVYSINMYLHFLKATIRQNYQGTDSIQLYTQQVERTRDSLYRRIFTENQFLLYRQKKRNLINNN